MNRVSLVVVAASVLLLTACVPKPVGDDSPEAPPKPLETVIADEPKPEAPSDVLFTVTATTADDMGAPVTLTMTGHAPQHWDAPGREAVKNDFVDLCTALGGGSVMDESATLGDASLEMFGSTLMVIDTVSTPAGHNLEPIDLLAGSAYYQQVASGDVVAITEVPHCIAGNQLVTTGAVHGITNYETGKSEGDLAQWLTGSYGFAATFGTSTTFTSCSYELTPLAATFDLTLWPGWDAAESTESHCWIGYQGE